MSVDFEQLYQTYYMEIYSFVMTKLRNRAMAEEVTQNVFYKAMKTESKYRGNANELTWLCAIAKNACMDELRRQSRYRDFDEDIISDENVEKLLEDEETTLYIYQILHELEEPYKEVFQLRIFGELSFIKIGKIFGKTENWARVTYHRARLKIRERMEEHEI